MQTNAQIDMFKEKQYKELFQEVERTKLTMVQTSEEQSIKDIEKEIELLRQESTTYLGRIITNIKGAFNYFTETTENLARILGFILNKEVYGKSFDESVQKSLKMWFNYGQRSPIEIQLMYDIPYISFPIRSINNWMDRILNPSYARHMDDIIDGAFGQYTDEDGQYDNEFMIFMIQNGWIPLTNKMGVRAGSGIFDIQNILKDPAGQITQRRNPILRGLQQFIETGELKQATSQLVTTGRLQQASKLLTLGSYNPKTKTWGESNVGSMFTATFSYNNYEKYIPYKYNYLRNSNGRYKYYENIYRDWFTKYGRMRKPTVDPVQLVKNIQWKQFLKRMQNKYK